MRFIVDHQPTPFQAGDSLLVAMLRAGLHPTGGGCLCLAGDCCHCLATVDGVAYARTCQISARPGLVVERDHRHGDTPPLIRHQGDELTSTSEVPAPEVPARHVYCDVVVIGMGSAGRQEAARARQAGKEVVTLDAGDGQEVAGIYHGLQVVARTEGDTLCVHAREEIVVATGAAEIQPVAPGTELQGLLTARAASTLAKAGIDLGKVVAVGTSPEGVAANEVSGQLLRFEGEGAAGSPGKVTAVVLLGDDGEEHTHECDTVSLGLGFHPRDALTRTGRELPVRAVGDAARQSDIPPCPRAGTVCACSGVTVDDLDQVWKNGFHELELVKRATLAGTGTCQGSACMPHIRSFLQDRGKELQLPFTARPLTRQLTLGEIAAGAFHPPTAHTALYEEHVRLGAQMERAGGWWRPWTYGDEVAEYWAAREAVSICDVSSLGKFAISGPDAPRLLEHLYPTRVASIKPGRSRYALLLDERGYVLDDGLICRDSDAREPGNKRGTGDTRFTLTLTSAGSTFGELWIRDWAEALDADVRIMNQTMTLGAINVTGPLAAVLLARAGATELPEFAHHLRTTVAGIECRIFRLSFTGELSYELHHAAEYSVPLWRRLLKLGGDLGLRPHGLKTLLDLRLEKGHIVVGKDTDFDSTPRRIHHEWAVNLKKDEFVGRQALLRTDKIPLDRQLVGLEMELPAPIEGAVVWHGGPHSGGQYAGYVTSSADSHLLGKAVMLAWVSVVEGTDGELPTEVTIDGRVARRVPTPFHDPPGTRARATVKIGPSDLPVPKFSDSPDEAIAGTHRFERPVLLRVVATPKALERTTAELLDGILGPSISWQVATYIPPTFIAPDEVLMDDRSVEGDPEEFTAKLEKLFRLLGDRHAIVTLETGFAQITLSTHEAMPFLEHTCGWELPKPPTEGEQAISAKAVFTQGAVAGIPVKMWIHPVYVHVLVPAPFAADFEEHLTVWRPPMWRAPVWRAPMRRPECDDE